MTGAGAASAGDAAIMAALRGWLDRDALTEASARATQEGVSLLDALIATALDREALVARLAEKFGFGVQVDPLWPLVHSLTADAAGAAFRSGVLRLDDGTIIVAARGEPLKRALELAYTLPRKRFRLVTPQAFADLVLAAGGEALARRARTGPRRIDRRLSARNPQIARISAIVLLLAALAALAAAFGRALAMDVVMLVAFASVTWIRLLAVANPPAPHTPLRAPDAMLPLYTVLVPLYREAACLPDLLRALEALDYPAAKLDIKLLVEAEDRVTRAALEGLPLPGPVEVLVVPEGGPRTKPRALNVGLAAARGAVLTIYDAEDRPEPGQLREAAAALALGGPKLACVQARLVIDNTFDNWISALFTIEYAALFDVLLPGLAGRAGLFPLGGTSNHFRTAALERVGGWDAWNVTEDADLGVRLVRCGYRLGVINSSTLEEAPNRLRAWVRQRTRWMQGYVLTWVVHMRQPRRLLRDLGWRNFLIFHAFIGGVPLCALMLPVFAVQMGLQVAAGEWFDFGGIGSVLVVLCLLDLVLGVGAAVAIGLIGIERRRLAGLKPLLLLKPLYWLMISWATWRAVRQLYLAPHVWEKTEHGLAKTSRATGKGRRPRGWFRYARAVPSRPRRSGAAD